MLTHVHVRLFDPDDDLASIEEATTDLREALGEPGVWAVDAQPGPPPPPGARSVDVAVLGGLLVTLAGSPDGLGALLSYVEQWLRRDPVPRTVEMTIGDESIRVTGISDETQRRLVAQWLERHRG